MSHADTIRGLVGHGVLADQVGLDFFCLGEHHTVEMPLSAPDLVLAAVAARTSRIHLGSAVTVLSSDDPVRVFQRYATLDALSNGRAEVILGGPTARFRPFADLFREAQRRLGLLGEPIGVHSPGHVADTDEQAREELFPHYSEVLTRMSRQRGFRPPSREGFDQDVSANGSWYVGSPATVARKIAVSLRTLGATRFDLEYGLAGHPAGQVLRTSSCSGPRSRHGCAS